MNVVKDNWALRALAHSPANEIKDEQVAAAVEAIAADPRVRSIKSVGRDESGRAMVEIAAVDTIDGDLNGVFSIGRIINALTETHSEHKNRLEEQAREPERRRQEEERRKWANAKLLERAGIHIIDVVRVVNKIARGSYLTDEERRIYADYDRLVVRDGDRPLKIAFYLPNCVSHI